MDLKEEIPKIQDIKDIKKILVKCPPALDDVFNTFPFLLSLSEEFPKAEINLICEEGTSTAFHFLPFKIRAFERPKEKVNLIQTHHFCANLNDVFNIDLFFDLENTFVSSFLGFNFRAKERVGYGVGWNKYFLTKNFAPDASVSSEKKYLRLLELYTEKKFQDLRISRVRTEGQQVEKIEQLFQEPEPPKFVLVMLDNFQNVTKQMDKWTKFFDSFENQKFIIWSFDDEDLISELFLKVDLGKNNLYMHRGKNIKEMIYLLGKVQGVVTNNIWSEGLCTYFGVNSVSFLINPPALLPSYQYFYFKPQRFFFDDSGAIKLSYQGEEREMQEMNQVVDQIHFQFGL
ncbi:MAG: glycosyltransferase family 9 protein [Bacteriovorax sp.]